MRDLSITFYHGQIRPEYRGNSALFMEIPEMDPVFTSFQLGSPELVAATEGMHSPMRAYIGVNEQAEPALVERFKKGKLNSVHGLDVVIVREEIVKRRYEECCDLQSASLAAAIATGK